MNAIGQRTNLATSGSAFANAPSWLWGYDSLGQVISANSNVNTSDRAYQYDTIGNRLKSADSLTLPTSNNYTPNGLNQYTATPYGSAGVPPAYDFDGNMTSGPIPAAPASNSALAWDAENRLVSVTVGSSATTCLYDAQARRIAVTTGGNTTLYVYDGFNCITEYSRSVGVSPTLQKTRLWGIDLSGSLQGAGGVGGLLAEKQGSNFYHPLFDGNGNVSEYLAADGSIAAHFEFDPFGNTVVNTDSGNIFYYRFSTKPLDFSTGLYYYQYRWYDPMTGRWPSRDPIEEHGGFNLYGFVGNNPNDIFDPLGLYEFVGYPSKDFIAIGSSSRSDATAIQVYSFRRIWDCGKKTSSTAYSTDVHLGALPTGDDTGMTYVPLINKGVTTSGVVFDDRFAVPCTSGEAIFKVTFITLDEWHIKNQNKLDYLLDKSGPQSTLINRSYANGDYELKGKKTARDPYYSYNFQSGRFNANAWENKVTSTDGIIVKVKWNFCSGHGDFYVEAYNLLEGNINLEDNEPIAGTLSRGHVTPIEPGGYIPGPEKNDKVFRASIKYPPTP